MADINQKQEERDASASLQTTSCKPDCSNLTEVSEARLQLFAASEIQELVALAGHMKSLYGSLTILLEKLQDEDDYVKRLNHAYLFKILFHFLQDLNLQLTLYNNTRKVFLKDHQQASTKGVISKVSKQVDVATEEEAKETIRLAQQRLKVIKKGG
jgi:hypothetical protein